MIKKITFLFALLLILQGCGDTTRKSIKRSVDQKMENYPESTLKDLYKSYFQDYFGPGHLVADTAAAKAYLLYELQQNDYIDTLLIDPAGYENNFVRVNLLLVKNGTIPVDTFFRYFLKSANSVQGIPIEAWREKWGEIVSVIDRDYASIPGYESDKQAIDSMLNEGDYVVHHSERYLEAYHPHYRIIERGIFNSNLSKYMD